MKPKRAASIRQWGAIQIVQHLAASPMMKIWINGNERRLIDADELIAALKLQDNRARKRKGGP